MPAGIGLGLLLAVTAHRKLRGIGVYRTVFSSTVATSVAVAAVIFSMLFNPIVGLLPWLGIDPRPPIIENPDLALGAVALVTVWQTLGLTFILLSAGLQAIPDELLEAAQVDGAGPVTRFWRVTIPMLSPTLFFAFVIGTIHAFQSFGQIDILTGGGPYGRTNVLTYSIFSALNPAKGAADPGRGRGPRDRALLHHARTDAGADAGARTAGALCAVRRRARVRRLRRFGSYLLLTVLAFIVLFPIYITIVNSLLRPVDIASRPPKFFPFHPQWSSYTQAWNEGHMSTYLLNSFIVTIMITVGQVVTAILAGYAFAFLEFPFKRTLFFVFLATLMVPFEVTIVANVADDQLPRVVRHLPRARGAVPRHRVSARSSTPSRSP